MDRPIVVIAESISPAAVAALEAVARPVDATGDDRESLLGRLHSAHGLIVRSATKVDAELLAAAPVLRVVGRAGIGVDNIDVAAATYTGVMVVNAPDANTISAAEHTMALLLAQARRIPAADASLRSGKWDRTSFQGVELHGKTLGILGLGRIGTLVAQRASAFGMRVVAHDPFVGDDRARRIGVRMGSLADVLAESDFVTIHLPRTRETEGLIDAAALRLTKRGVRIVNVARGGIVDEQALADAIVSGHVGGAAVDVFAVEPTTDSPLFGLEHVVVTPHLGASTVEAQDKAGLAVASAVAAALAGGLVPSAVNLDLGPKLSDDARPHVELAERLGRLFAQWARGLPAQLVVLAQGREAAPSIRAVALGAMKGALQASSDELVTYVNATMVAERRGMVVLEEASPQRGEHRSLVRLSGEVGGEQRTVSGSVVGDRGDVLVDVDGYVLEFPLSTHMLLLANTDIPGVIGRVGTTLGDAAINIADMAVGRSASGGAMMGISVDQEPAAAVMDRLRRLDGVLKAASIRLP
ncbi:MAG: phosphoglycerate dehydrogenase [Acidimicrobiia bacterium]|nr:phosphoglycerate dehydrogenase [Acidimicrobiia bacterium]